MSHFLASEFTDRVLKTFFDIALMTFVGIIFVIFVDTLAFTISSYKITEKSLILFKYLPLS